MRLIRPIFQAIFAAALLMTAQTTHAQDDWHVVERHTNSGASDSRPAPSATSNADIVACGEPARPPDPQIKAIVGQLNDMWGTSFPVFQSPRRGSPHAHTGGCIFYNSDFLKSLVQQWMNIKDQDSVDTILYAIFAHELGHLAHGDFEPGAEAIPLKNKELAADQFAGYSLARLGRRRLDSSEVTQYYQLTGDDFVGARSGHGNGAERSSAFQDGWHRAEIGLPEQGTRPAGGLGEP